MVEQYKRILLNKVCQVRQAQQTKYLAARLAKSFVGQGTQNQTFTTVLLLNNLETPTAKTKWLKIASYAIERFNSVQ